MKTLIALTALLFILKVGWFFNWSWWVVTSPIILFVIWMVVIMLIVGSSPKATEKDYQDFYD